MTNLYNNPLVLKVLGGTVRGDIDLCATCRWAHRTTGALTGQVKVRCNAVAPPNTIREPLASCTSHMDRTKPTLEQMESIAWNFVTAKNGRKLGFTPPTDDNRSRADSSPGF